MGAADVSRRCGLALRRGVATFLAIAGIVAIVLGLLYLSAGGGLPHLIQGRAHTGHHDRRATFCLATGAVCVIAAWMLRPRRAASGSRKSS